jgi:hypothetical protein
MLLNEIWGSGGDLFAWGFRLTQEEEREDDNSKLWHTVYFPDGSQQTLDHSPYQLIDMETFKRYLMFYREHKRFPTRKDINSVGPLNNEDLLKLTV